MKKAAIIGAGNIGRGFIGQILSEGGYEVCFIDVSEKIVGALNALHEYPLDIVSSAGTTRKMIRNVRAVNGNDREAAVDEIANCDVCVTCVGAKAIKFIIPNFVAGVKKRFSTTGRPINLLICENLMDADKYIHSLLENELTAEELASVGLVETSVGRMVPLPDPAMVAADPLRVCAEAYAVLPCDKDAFVGEIPEIKNVIPVSPFRYIIERKLYIHNMGHAVCAYLGMYKGYATISQAIADPQIRVIVREAMTESAIALAQRFDRSLAELLAHTSDLIRRFGNTALGDTCARVGADIPRKLAASDRLTGAAASVAQAGYHPVWLAVGAGAALYQHAPENAPQAFRELTGCESGEYEELALRTYEMLKNGADLDEIIRASDATLAEVTGAIM